jgi:hypothetical protein
MSKRLSRVFVLVLGAMMIGIAAVAIVSRQPQYRLPMDPEASFDQPLVLEKSGRVLEIHGLEPIEPLPSPTEPEALFAPWPDNPLYGYIHWSVRTPDGRTETWEVQFKQLEDEFIGWPVRLD